MIITALALSVALTVDEPKTATIDLAFRDLSQRGQEDFRKAADVWERCLISDAPIKVLVTGIERGPTGFAGQNAVRNQSYLPKRNAWYPTALASALRGKRVTDEDDINIFFKETMGENEARHYSADDPLTDDNAVDVINVALHEIAHGLGISSKSFVPWEGEPVGSIGLPNDFVDYFTWSFPYPEQDGTPEVYDTFLRLADGRRITRSFANPSMELTFALANPTIQFDGKHAKRANGGFPVGVTPLNVSHIPAFPRRPTPIMLSNSGRGESIRHPDKILLGMLQDLGWGITETCIAKAQ